ncbi:type III secretion system cytoplasmic ring protein SctQ, partial [Agrobacterium tumefaciens]|uniref:type III secretion system cytoplasmic ring protein SctQ n=1 Tax=Agrobacterium tumefaciens TaxID=358 RepID=UPI003BA2C25A
RDDASVHAIVLMLSAAVLQRLSASWVQAMPRASRSLSALTLPLAIQVGWQRLSLAQCRRLRPGDVVMLETFPGGARVTVADAVAAQAVAHASGMQLTSAFHPFSCFDELCMTAALAPSVDSVRDDPLDRVPIELVCEIARVQMPLGELRALGVGTVLPAGPSTADVVDLRVNGQRVGRGELVRLGDGVGVRITQLTADA